MTFTRQHAYLLGMMTLLFANVNPVEAFYLIPGAVDYMQTAASVSNGFDGDSLLDYRQNVATDVTTAVNGPLLIDGVLMGHATASVSTHTSSGVVGITPINVGFEILQDEVSEAIVGASGRATWLWRPSPPLFSRSWIYGVYNLGFSGELAPGDTLYYGMSATVSINGGRYLNETVFGQITDPGPFTQRFFGVGPLFETVLHAPEYNYSVFVAGSMGLRVVSPLNSGAGTKVTDAFGGTFAGHWNTVAGDFNGDGHVDGADFVIWQTNFPNNTGMATIGMGDANRDANIDGADFVIWQTNFPYSPSQGAAPVPEPAGCTLGMLSLLGCLWLRRRRFVHRQVLAIVAAFALAGTSVVLAKDPWLGQEVFWKQGAQPKVGNQRIDRKSIPFPATVTEVNGDWLWVGRAWIRKQDVMLPRQALDYFTDWIRANPSDAAAYSNRGAVWETLGELDNAIRDYTESIRLDPRDTFSYSNRGLAFSAKGDYDSAIKDYAEAIRLDPRNAFAYYNRGNAFDAKGDYDRAIKDFTEAIRIDPKDASSYNNRGNSYRLKGDYDRAIKDSTEALRLDPRDVYAYNNRATALKSKGDYDSAIKDYAEAIRIDPKNDFAHNNRGLAFRLKGDYDSAIKDHSEAIRLNPEYASAYSNRGWARHLQQDYDGALRDYDEVIRLDPQTIHAFNNKAFLLATCPQESYRSIEDALASAEQALRIDPKDGYAKSAKACALALSGDFAGAIRLQEEALQDSAYAKDDAIDGGKHAPERIAAWKRETLWLAEPK